MSTTQQATEKQAAYAVAMIAELIASGNNVPVPAGETHRDWILSLSQQDASKVITSLEQMTGRKLMPTAMLRG